MDRFAPGTQIVVRGHRQGAIRTTKAVIAVEDTERELSYWWPAGTDHTVTTAMLHARSEMLPHTMAELRSGEWRLATAAWDTTDVLAATQPGSWAVVWHMWSHDTGEFLRWYVDLKRPHTRTQVGFDTYDLDLDLVVTPDGAWEWKDRGEFDARYDAGLITDSERAAVLAAGEAMLPIIEAQHPPFDGSRIEWRPDPAWAQPHHVEGWDTAELTGGL